MQKTFLMVVISSLMVACGGGSNDSTPNTTHQTNNDNNSTIDNTVDDNALTFSSNDAADEDENPEDYLGAPTGYKDGKAYKFVILEGDHTGNFNFSNIKQPIDFLISEDDMTSDELLAFQYFGTEAKKTGLTASISDLAANFENYININNYPNNFSLSSGNLVDVTSKSYSLYKGKREAELMKFACFNAITLGQQEQKMPNEEFAEFAKTLIDNPYCSRKTAIISANMSKEKKESLANYGVEVDDYFTQEIYWGKTMAWIGVSDNTNVQQTTDSVQQVINKLLLKDIKHIGLLSSMGVELDKKMLESLTDVDVVIGRLDNSVQEPDFKTVDPNLKSVYGYESINRHGKKVCMSYNSNQIIGESSFHATADIHGDVIKCKKLSAVLYADESSPDDYFKNLESNLLVDFLGTYRELEMINDVKVEKLEEKYPL